jgi:uncharacterized protein YfaP (DUF2135 family)
MFRESRLTRIVLLLFFVVLVGYALFEARGLFSGPVINVPQGTMTVAEPSVLIQGTAERITELRLNGAQISVTEDGAFSERYLLVEGSNHLILEARDARGRTTKENLTIMYRPTLHAETPN